MTHPRQTIRSAVATILQAADISGVGTTGVHSQRGRRYGDYELPAINILCGAEASQRRDLSTEILRRDLQVTLELTVKDTDELNLDDALDDMALAVEAAIKADPTLGDSALDAVLSATSEVEKDVDGEVNVGRRNMTYNVIYFA